MANIVDEATSELKHCNPMYNSFVFDEAKAFLSQVQANRDIAPSGSYAVRENLLFAVGQGFVTGYGAALDSDYNKEARETCNAEEFRLATELAGTEEEWQLARVARFYKTLVKEGGNGPVAYYATYGFAMGLSKGLSDIADGSIEKKAGTPSSNMFVEEICNIAIGEVLEEYSPDIMFLAGGDAGKKTKGMKKRRKRLEKIISSATCSFVSSISCGYSGYNESEPELVYNRAETYAAAFIDGFSDASEGRHPDEYDLSDIPDEMLEPLGTFANIDAHYGSDAVAADIAKASMMKLLEKDDDEDFLDEEEREEMPPFSDAFWQICAIGYADGYIEAGKHPEYRQEDSDVNNERFTRLIDEEIERLNKELQANDKTIKHLHEVAPVNTYHLEPSMFDERTAELPHIKEHINELMRDGFTHQQEQTVPYAEKNCDLIDKFEDALAQYGDIIAAISTLNSLTLMKVPLREEALEFGDYIDAVFEEDPAAKAAVWHNWEFQGGPRILRIVDAYRNGEEPPRDVITLSLE